MQKDKLKVLVLSDHALSTSGVGTQTRHLLTGLIEKGCWSFRQFGAALKHSDYRTVVVNEDLIIKPIDGFGDPDLLRVTIATEKPDAIFLFTDPRLGVPRRKSRWYTCKPRVSRVSWKVYHLYRLIVSLN